jgi:hypothetical protein
MQEAEWIAKYAPQFISFVAVILLIVFIKNYLFKGVISTDQYERQLVREQAFITATQNAANNLGDIGKQLEGITKKVSEEIGHNTERIRTLEMVISDFLDEFRELNRQFDRYRHNIPDTERYNMKQLQEEANERKRTAE